MARYATREAVENLVLHAIPEGPTPEYKEELALGAQADRRELLKDLSAMGNGGGGVVIYGMREKSGEHPAASEIAPMSDRSLVGMLEDVVRAGIRLTLLAELSTIDFADGYVLSVDVRQSPLGPYMVESYGDSRYYLRVGTRSAPMSEAQVRDAYSLAARGRDRRADVWMTHALPIPLPNNEPRVSVSTIPEEPLREIVDLTVPDAEAIRPGSPIADHLSIVRLQQVAHTLGRWAGGLYADDAFGNHAATSAIRLHLDGAAGIAMTVIEPISPIWAARVVNAELAYLAWWWESIDLAHTVELRLRLDNLVGHTLNIGEIFTEERLVREPLGMDASSIEIIEVLLGVAHFQRSPKAGSTVHRQIAQHIRPGGRLRIAVRRALPAGRTATQPRARRRWPLGLSREPEGVGPRR
ncbi:MAG: helix-turn-helix domain-containing protein [Acidimicrobiia bacterium]